MNHVLAHVFCLLPLIIVVILSSYLWRSIDGNQKRQLGDESPEYANCLNNLAGLYQKKGEHSKALSLYEKSLEISRKILGDYHLDTATCINNIAELYRIQGDQSKAEELYEKSLEIITSIVGENNPHLAFTLNNLGILYYQKR